MSSRWPRAVVPFELNNKNGRLKEEAVVVAMKKIEKDTCIRFVPREKKHKKYLVVKSIGGAACWTKNIGDSSHCQKFEQRRHLFRSAQHREEYY